MTEQGSVSSDALAPVPTSPQAEAAELAITIPPDLLDALADQLAARVAAMLKEQADADRWFGSDGAAEYLGMTKNALHKLTSTRQVPFEQDGPGCKLHFRRSELDRWRSGGMSKK